MEKPLLYYTETLPRLLYDNNYTLALTAYQAGKLILVSSTDRKNLTLFAKSFKRPMGIALDGDKLAVASKFEVDVFKNVPKLAKTFPGKSKEYDALYIPQLTYYTGYSDIHEIAWGKEGLWAVNTTFSCLSVMDDAHNFFPKWKPWFISGLVPEDRCHMNGFALDQGVPVYVSMYDQSDTKEGWRKTPFDSGLIVDVNKQEIVCDKLPMPHSPMVSGKSLYFLLSAVGKVMEFDLSTREIREIATLDGFLRGMTEAGGYLFIGRSEKRESAKTFKDLPVHQNKCTAGISVIDKSSGTVAASLTFTERIREIFSLRVIEGFNSPCMIGTSDTQRKHCIHLSEDLNYWVKI
ncbi:MAG: TIGR03032 family protein [Bacteroidales bacterium]|nr:TIGR03032 family protein [Bacteroidales bacterium]